MTMNRHEQIASNIHRGIEQTALECPDNTINTKLEATLKNDSFHIRVQRHAVTFCFN